MERTCRLCSYRAVETIPLSYKNQSGNAVQADPSVQKVVQNKQMQSVVRLKNF